MGREKRAGIASRGTRRRVLLVDDHPVVRKGLVQMIAHTDDLSVCGEAPTAEDAMTAIAEREPDIVILDISLPDMNGLDAVRRIKAEHPALPILVFSVHDEALYARRALQAGARGYVMKQEPGECILMAIRKVLQGGYHLSDAVNTSIVRELAASEGARHLLRSGVEALSDRELDVFNQIGRGLSPRSIAERLHLSHRTVLTHRAHIKRKLGASDNAALARKAVHWVDLETSRTAR